MWNVFSGNNSDFSSIIIIGNKENKSKNKEHQNYTVKYLMFSCIKRICSTCSVVKRLRRSEIT